MAAPKEELFQWFAGELAEERSSLESWLDLKTSCFHISCEYMLAFSAQEIRHQALLKDKF